MRDDFGMLNLNLSDFYQTKIVFVFLTIENDFEAYYYRLAFKHQGNKLSLIDFHYLIFFTQSGYKPQ